MPAGRVATYIRNGVLKAMPDAVCKQVPLADGGEGTVETLVEATGGRIENTHVHDPLMRQVNSFFGICGDGKTAVIEMAAASGLALLKPGERNPLVTTTFGTGELIRHALDKGCREIILGIGGSATVDGGVGMAQALGVRFRDEFGQEIGTGGGSLRSIAEIDRSERDPRLSRTRIFAACDVINRLTGPTGAASVYGPQKGATPAMVKKLDKSLKHMAGLIYDLWDIEVDDMPGAGAAGGLGAGIVAFLNGELKSGFELISHTVDLVTWIRWADLVVTGEGKIDLQTAFGKTPAGVAGMAAGMNRLVIAFTGSLDGTPEKVREMGFASVIPIADKPMTLEQSIADAGILLENAAERVFRLIALGKIL